MSYIYEDRKIINALYTCPTIDRASNTRMNFETHVDDVSVTDAQKLVGEYRDGCVHYFERTINVGSFNVVILYKDMVKFASYKMAKTGKLFLGDLL